MNRTLEQKEKHRDLCFSKSVLVLQTLVHEEVIKKNTYDSIYNLIVDMDKNNPTMHDFVSQLFEKSEKTTVSKVVSLIEEEAWITYMDYNGKKYQIQIKPVK